MIVPVRLNALPGILVMNVRPFDEANISRADRMNLVVVGSVAKKTMFNQWKEKPSGYSVSSGMAISTIIAGIFPLSQGINAAPPLKVRSARRALYCLASHISPILLSRGMLQMFCRLCGKSDCADSSAALGAVE